LSSGFEGRSALLATMSIGISRSVDDVWVSIQRLELLMLVSQEPSLNCKYYFRFGWPCSQLNRATHQHGSIAAQAFEYLSVI
jgi:hypothetical protein